MNPVRVEKMGYVAKEGEMLLKVNRSSLWGNPFVMHGENTRDEVCELFESNMKNELAHNPEKWEAMDAAVEMVTKKGHSTVLICHCHPKRCHADTIAAWLNTRPYLTGESQ
jgi:hypothetical protein